MLLELGPNTMDNSIKKKTPLAEVTKTYTFLCEQWDSNP